jgi:hypothetical protein
MADKNTTSGSISIGSFTYPEDVVSVTLSDPVIAAVSPDTEEAGKWGVFQFPMIWRSELSGKIQLQIHNGLDTQGRAGYQDTPLYFESSDEGKSWVSIPEDKADFTPRSVPLPGRGAVRLGRIRDDVHQHETPSSAEPDDLILPGKLGLKPRGEFLSPNGHGIRTVYRYGDIPEEARSFPVWVKAPEEKWTLRSGTLDFPELLIGAFTRSLVYGEWQPVEPRISKPRPQAAVCDAAGVIYGIVGGQHPEKKEFFGVIYCAASEDGGITWKKRGVIADQADISLWGFSKLENDLHVTKTGELVAVSRTDMSRTDPGDPRYTVLSRSADGGRTWTRSVPIAPYSVRPQLIPLQNGVTALLYGRPGVHLFFSDDPCRKWHTPRTVIGRHAEEFARIAEHTGENLYGLCFGNDTCGNARHVITGPDRFLVAYSDFTTRSTSGRMRKLIKVREVRVY